MAYKRRFCSLVLGVALAMAIPVYCSTVSIFNFDSDVLGTPTPFSHSNNGLTATFSSTGDPGGFVVAPTFFLTLTGNVLLDRSIICYWHSAHYCLQRKCVSRVDELCNRW